MAVEFLMPKLGLTMEEGTIIEWLVADGTEVEQGTPVLTIGTDKVESDVEASSSGVLAITGAPGDVHDCGERIGWFLEPGEERPTEEPSAATPTAPSPTPTAAASPAAAPPVQQGRDGARVFASPNAKRVAAERGVDLGRLTGSGPGGRIVSEDVPATPTGDSAPYATRAAGQSAARLGIDLRDVRPARPGARVDRADVELHVRQRLGSGVTAPEGTTIAALPDEAPLLQEPSGTVPLTGMRGTIATRMHASLREMAQLTLTMDVVMDAVVEQRSRSDRENRPGYTDYVLAAAAAALRDHPVVNSQIVGGQLALLPQINLGMAVALDGGLVVPVIERADSLSLGELRAETTRLAGAARTGRLSLDELEGATFSVTTLGMFGVDAFTPVINPPNTAILGVGRLRDGIRWVDGSASQTRVLTLSLTWDHRAFDGAPAAEFAAAVRRRLEEWEKT